MNTSTTPDRKVCPVLLEWGRQLVAELGLLTRADLDARLAPITTTLERFMTDVSPVLTTLAEDLRAFGEGPFAALLADNAQKTADLDAAKTRIASLEGSAAETATAEEAEEAEDAAQAAEDARESGAAAQAVDAFNAFAKPVTESPDVPVEVPVVELPEIPEPSPDVAPVEPAPADDGTVAVETPGVDAAAPGDLR